jgi:hypothetical protein
MLRCAVAVLVIAAAVVCTSQAQQPKKQPLSGTWKKTAGEVKLSFEFKGRALHFSMAEGDKTLDIKADFGTSSDGHVFGRVNKVEKNGINEGPDVGDLFSFRYEMKRDTLTISELRGTDSEQARNLIQGDYTGAPAPTKAKVAD